MKNSEGRTAHGSNPKCGTCHWNCLQLPYKRFMYNYGLFVGRHPWWFIIPPFIICIALATGIYFNMTYVNDANNLYTPKQSLSLKNKNRIKELFPSNASWEHVARASVTPKNAILMVEALNGNVLDEDSYRQILAIDNYIRHNITTASGKGIEQLCAKWRYDCVVDHPVFKYLGHNASNINKASVTYPLTYVSGWSIPLIAKAIFGKPTLSNDGKTLLKAQYLSWDYLLREDLDEETTDWLVQLYTIVENEVLESSGVKLWMYSDVAIDQELKKTSDEMFEKFTISLLLMVLFSVLTCLMMDPVRSKPLLATAGALSSLLATGAAFGFLFYIGEPFTAIVGLVLFLSIAIGVDGMFVLLSTWRHTSSYLPVEERMALTFQDGGVSVTITALTDIAGMAVGIINPFRGIELFCRFATLATVMDLIMQLTFFAGVLALTGQRERGNRHSLAPCMVLPAPSEAQKTNVRRNWCTSFFCLGGVSKSGPSHLDNKQHVGTIIFGKHVASWIRKPAVISLAVLLYLAYIGGAIYGCLDIKEGFRRNDIALTGSKYADLVDIVEQNFLGQYLLTVVIDTPLVYSSKHEQTKINTLLSELLQEKESKLQHGISWFQSYSNFLDKRGIQPKSEEEYIWFLRHIFLRHRLFEHYKVDVVFNSNYSAIVASRFYLTATMFETTREEKNSYIKLTEITKNHELEAFVYSSFFAYAEQYILILPLTIQILGSAALAMLIISFLLLPNPLISVIVTLSIVSIQFGLLGYMSLWSVRMDVIAMLTMLISVGFVVDFTAHMAYIFVTTAAPNRLKQAMSLIGFPLVQSSLSTVVGVSILAFSLSPMCRAFFKMMSLLMLFGTVHGLLWIPITLSLVMSCMNCRRSAKRVAAKEPVHLSSPSSPPILLSHSQRNRLKKRSHVPFLSQDGRNREWSLSAQKRTKRSAMKKKTETR